MDQADHSLVRLIAMYFSPFALPHLTPNRNASRRERKRIRCINMLRIRPFMRGYIFRSGQLVLSCFIASLLFASLLPVPLLAVAASVGIFLAILHTVVLIFVQQSANDIAAKIGLNNHDIEP